MGKDKTAHIALFDSWLLVHTISNCMPALPRLSPGYPSWNKCYLGYIHYSPNRFLIRVEERKRLQGLHTLHDIFNPGNEMIIQIAAGMDGGSKACNPCKACNLSPPAILKTFLLFF
jgi:hypothetical protein